MLRTIQIFTQYFNENNIIAQMAPAGLAQLAIVTTKANMDRVRHFVDYNTPGHIQVEFHSVKNVTDIPKQMEFLKSLN